MIEMLRVKNCCCICSLTTGTILIIIFHLLPICIQIFQNKSTLLFNIGALIIIVLALVGVCLRKQHLLIPFIVKVLFELVWAVICLIRVFIYGIEAVPKKELAPYVFSRVTDVYGENATTEKNVGVEQTDRDNLLVYYYAVALILSILLNAYFFIVLLSYYFELEEELLRNSAGSGPTTQTVTVAGSYGVDQMPQGESIVMENLYPKQTQSSGTSAETKTVFVSVSDSVFY